MIARDGREQVVKLCGGDIELANFFTGTDAQRTGSLASRLLLQEIRGVSRRLATDLLNPQDWGRRYLTNGGCAYEDLSHLELCLPEVTHVLDHLASWHAMLRIARDAQLAANARLEPPLRVELLASCSDGQGHSWGSHLNFLVTRRAFDDLFNRRLQDLLFLASFQATAPVYTGAGKVGAERRAPDCDFQLTQRADFFDRTDSFETTFARGLVNRRDEALAASDRFARVHVIYFDSNLCHVAHVLKVGALQLVLALIEAGRASADLILEDPVGAAVAVSHDPTLERRVRLLSGREVTAVEHQLLILERVRAFVEEGGCDGIVPGAKELILPLWTDTLEKLRRRDLPQLASRLDWVLKLATLERATSGGRLRWESPEVKHLDHQYASVDTTQGLYWAYEAAGLVERLVTPGQIERRVHEPPEESRAWTRAKLLAAAPERVLDVDWDRVTFSLGNGRRAWALTLDDPLAGKAETGSAFEGTSDVDLVLERLGAHAVTETPLAPITPTTPKETS